MILVLRALALLLALAAGPAAAQLSIEITGSGSKIEKFLALVTGFGILDLTRTGQVALPRD